MVETKVLTATEVARRLLVSHRTVERWSDGGIYHRITPVRTKPLLFSTADVDDLAAEIARELAAKIAHLEATA